MHETGQPTLGPCYVYSTATWTDSDILTFKHFEDGPEKLSKAPIVKYLVLHDLAASDKSSR